MLRDAGYWEAVIGQVLDQETRKPVPGVRVRVYDKDVVLDDHLGEALTDERGRFRVDFPQRAYQGAMSLAEGRPDIYVRLEAPDGRKATTKVHYEMEGKMEKSDDPEKKGPDGEIEVMDLGVILLPPAD